MICWHKDCTAEARHTIVTGEELCDLHLAVLRALHERRAIILDPGLAGEPETDLAPVETAIDDLVAAFVAPAAEEA